MDANEGTIHASDGTRMLNSPVKATALYAISRGVPLQTIVAATGVSDEVLLGPAQWLPHEVMPVLWRLLLNHLPGEPVTLQMAERASLDFYGPMGSIMEMIPTLGDSLRLQVRFATMFSDQLQVAVIEEGREAVVRYSHEMDALDGGCAAEAATSVGVYIVRKFLDAGPALLRVEFAHPPLWPVQTYENHFGVPVYFERGPQHAVVYRRSALSWPTSRGDAQMLPFIERYLEREHKRMGARGGFGALGDVRAAIVANAEMGRFDATGAARRLGVSLRSLQRTVRQHDTTMKALIQEVRLVVAKRALADDRRSLAEVAARAGYADVRSFRRAFLSWTGVTPAQMRREQQ